MNRTVLISLMAVVLSAASNGQQLEEQRVAVFLDFEKASSLDVMQQMRRQAERLLRPLGFVPEWRLLQENRGRETFPNLAVIRFRGKCQGTASIGLELQPRDSTPALASSAVSGGNVLPFGEVYCDKVQRFLHPELTGLRTRQQERLFGHALGSLVAHELYHILTNSIHHDHEGVGKSRHCPRDLLSQSVSFANEATTGTD